MKTSVMSLSDFQRGGAWPSSVRTVKRSVKSDNERDPHLYLLPFSPEEAHHRETAGAKPEEGEGNDRSVCPECHGLHARYKGRDNGKPGREIELTRNPFIVRIVGCNSPT
jgi:hypothetical protein